MYISPAIAVSEVAEIENIAIEEAHGVGEGSVETMEFEEDMTTVASDKLYAKKRIFMKKFFMVTDSLRACGDLKIVDRFYTDLSPLPHPSLESYSIEYG